MRLTKKLHSTEIESVSTQNEELKLAISELSEELKAKKKQLRELDGQHEEEIPLRRSLTQQQDMIEDLRREVEEERERADLEEQAKEYFMETNTDLLKKIL